ncbi:c-type cytochrome [Acidimangrovimonas sediminis]|uniref:c-type cytochrome n=1 Tax=Acidimangrovimonas sediminis TaxID=2056283 RepID=UPI000C80169F|nr:c-type cytochrome [Acidimangrovimonas sediminis]
MKTQMLAALAAIALASPALAAGDAAKGEKTFMRCKACHSITGADGKAIVRGGKVGPNLFGVVGRKAASAEGFNYGAGIKEAAEKGLVWNQEEIAEYVQDPTKFLQKYTGDDKAHSKMTYRLSKGGEDVAAYLATFSK